MLPWKRKGLERGGEKCQGRRQTAQNGIMKEGTVFNDSMRREGEVGGGGVVLG